MEDWEKINAVSRMQKYILSHIEEVITLRDLSLTAGYSLWHSARIFKELTGKTPFEYIRAIRLTTAAAALRDTDAKVVDAAMNGGYDSHDGFTRAFVRQFAITPQKYRNEKPPISYFTYYPIRDYYLHYTKKDAEEMEKGLSGTVTIQPVERPARKMILLRSIKAMDYFSYCEENGCDWEGLLNSVPERFENAAIVELPQCLVKSGTSPVAAGIEVPAEYAKPVPGDYEIVELEPCTMLYFRGMPYDNEEDFCKAIEIVLEAVQNYKPELYGYAFADDIAPRFNFGASAAMGAKMAVPVKVSK